MFGALPSGAHAYTRLDIETGVLTATPHQLTAMLFDGAIGALHQALAEMRQGHIDAKGRAISKAIMIIDSGLRASLDKTAGGQLAEQLDALYEYMSRRLLLANLRHDTAMIEEVQRLLGELRAGWQAIADTPAATRGVK